MAYSPVSARVASSPTGRPHGDHHRRQDDPGCPVPGHHPASAFDPPGVDRQLATFADELVDELVDLPKVDHKEVTMHPPIPIRRICRSLGGLPQRAGALPASAWLVTCLTAAAMVPLAGLADAQQLVRSPGGQLPAPSGDAVIAWNDNAAKAALGACLAPANNPLHESRMYAMMHIAIHDALNAIDRRFARTP
jgi:hypothetical protein